MSASLAAVPPPKFWVRFTVRPRRGRGLGPSESVAIQVEQPGDVEAWMATFKGKVDAIDRRPLLHTCRKCGKTEPWGPTWSWFGSYKEIDDGKPVRKFCSVQCGGKLEEAEDL